MTLTFRQLSSCFAAEVSPVDLREVHDRETLEAIRAGMDEYAVLVFRDQRFTDDEQFAFAQRFDGTLQTKSGRSALMKSRLRAGLGDISNLDEDGNLLGTDSQRRIYQLGNRLWHTDASFQDPPGRYSMLHARVIPPVNADTEFADMRSAYDALDDETKAKMEGLHAHHSIAYSRQLLGLELTPEELKAMAGAVQSLVRTNPRTKRRSVYIAEHITRIMEWPVADGRLFVRDLMEHATRPEFRYCHVWRTGDLVIWDNLATMHRGKYFDDTKYVRDMRRVTSLDVDPVAAIGSHLGR